MKCIIITVVLMAIGCATAADPVFKKPDSGILKTIYECGAGDKKQCENMILEVRADRVCVVADDNTVFKGTCGRVTAP